MSFPLTFFKSAQKVEGTSSSRKDINCVVSKMDAKKLKGNAKGLDPNKKSQENSIIRPITCENIFFYYIPALGSASHALLSVDVLNPTLHFSFISRRDLTNILFATTLFGTGCYIYSRPHIKDSSRNGRYGFSALGSIMFNFSSVLVWAILRNMLPINAAICSAAGLASSYILVRGATNYIEFVENQISI